MRTDTGYVTSLLAGTGGKTAAVEAVVDLVGDGGVVVLSGAGLSTESGIPDYRGPSGSNRRHQPMTYQKFTRDPLARRRYWSRSQLGWRQIAGARPNHGHAAVAALQQLGLVDGIITQNVDGLHQAAGAQSVIELHGSLDRVVCLGCGQLTSRLQLDERLRTANQQWQADAVRVNPDGDVEISERDEAAFRVVDCLLCGGVLKPDVVFFGETVPMPRVHEAFGLVESAAMLLVLGSSLTVMSGHRFVLRAAKLGIPIVIVTQGTTRGDQYAAVKLDAPLGRTLTELVSRL